MPPSPNAEQLQRKFGPVQATALNMTNMIGIGPFITIPLLMSAMLGPRSMIGWALGLLICAADSMVWSELGAAMPGSGGSYVYLRQAFGREKWGRLFAFIFIWQFILSGPLEIASGYIGFIQYLKYIWPSMTDTEGNLLITIMGLITIWLLYRKIGSIAKITVSLWAGALLTTGIVIILGVTHFDPSLAFKSAGSPLAVGFGFLAGVGAATRIGVYDYLGYYDICYIGDEVRDPGRTIPRSIIISLLAVALIYLGINLSIIGVVPWQEFVPAADKPASNFVVSIFMERLLGSKAATLFTLLVMWTAFGSVFALLLGYSRIPYAAALDGAFFSIFAKLHPTKHFPHISLLVIGLVSILCSFQSLSWVIDALITARILVQFIAQIFAVVAIRRANPPRPLPFKMWLYPLPCLVAFFGWTFLFATSELKFILGAFGFLLAGLIAFLSWSSVTKKWPFDPANSRAAT